MEVNDKSFYLFNKVVKKGLCMRKANKCPISDGTKVYEVTELKVTTLRFTEITRTRIVKAGGECLIFDQLALLAPLG